MKFTKKTRVGVGITAACLVAAFLFVPYEQTGTTADDAGFTTQSYQRGSTYTRRSSTTTSRNRSYSSNYSRYRNARNTRPTRTTRTRTTTQPRTTQDDEKAKLAAYQQKVKTQQAKDKQVKTTNPRVTSSVSSRTTGSTNGSNTGSNSAGNNNPTQQNTHASAPAKAPSTANPTHQAGDIVYPNKGNASSLACPARDFNIAYNTKFDDNHGNEYKLKYGTKSFVSESNVRGAKKTLPTGGIQCKFTPNEVKDKNFELTLRYTSPCSETSEGNFQCSGGRQTSCPALTPKDFIRQVSHPQNDVQGQRFNWEEDTLKDMHDKSTIKLVQAYALPSGRSTNITCQYELDVKRDHFKMETHQSAYTDTKNEAYRIKSICPSKVEGNLNGFSPKGYVPGGSTYRSTDRYIGHNHHRCYYTDTYGQDVPSPLFKRYQTSELEECAQILTTDNQTRELRCLLK